MHNLDIQQVLTQLNSSLNGLNNKQVLTNRNKYGVNVIDKEKKKSLLVRFLAQFKNIMVLILLFSAIISISIAVINGQKGELFEGFVILFIVIMNAIVGVVQENKAEACIAELRKSEKTNAKVIRSGITQIVPTQDLVVGDIILIEAGDIVPADIRLIESNNLKTFAYYVSTLSNATGNTVAGQGIAAAGALLVFLPSLVLFIIMQSKVMDTMVHSGIK